MPGIPAAHRGVRAAGVPQSGAAIAQAALMVVAVLYFARDLLVPLALAVLLSFVLAPIARALRRFGLPRVAGVVVAVLAAVAVIASLGLVMGTQIGQLANDLPAYQAEIGRKLASMHASGGLIERAQEMLKSLASGAEGAARRTPAALAPDGPRPIPVEIRPGEPTPFAMLRNIAEPLLHPLATIGIVIVLVIFVLLYREDLRDRVIRLVGARDLHRTMAAMDDAAYRLSRYFLAQTALNAALGSIVALALYAIGVPQPVLWGILAGLMRFVPFVGTFIAVVFPLLLALAADPGWSMVLMVLALFVVAEGAMGQVVEPLVFGHSTGLSPIAVIAAATFWTWLWGPIGLVVAVPLTVCLVVLGRHVDRLEFLEVALGDRPPLDPPESFYQRALMGDADALAEQAEQVLRDKRLSAYYDEVALPALTMAQADALRGDFDELRLTAMRTQIAGLIEDLEEEADDSVPDAPLADLEADKPRPPETPVPASLTSAGAVLCMAGRGPFDAAAAGMLAQVLRKRGVAAVAAPAEVLRGGDMAAFDATAVRQAWLCTVEGGASSAAARYLLRRLRRRFPEAIVAAMVPGAGATARLPEALRTENAGAVETDIAATLRAVLRLAPVAAAPPLVAATP